MKNFKNLAKRSALFALTFALAIGMAVPASAADGETDKPSDCQTVTFHYPSLTDAEREELIRKEMEQLLGPDAEYHMYFGDPEAGEAMPLNDVDEYKTEYSNIREVTVTGEPRGAGSTALRATGETNYIGWTYSEEGGPSISKSIDFSAQYKIVTVSFSLGIISDTQRYSYNVGVEHPTKGVWYRINTVTKVYEVQLYTIYKKVYSGDTGSYTWEEFSGGKFQNRTGISFDIRKS